MDGLKLILIFHIGFIMHYLIGENIQNLDSLFGLFEFYRKICKILEKLIEENRKFLEPLADGCIVS